MLRILTILVACLSAGAAMAHVRIVSEPEVSAEAGQYATLAFPLTGEGSYRFEVTPPEGWTAVTGEGEVTLQGDGFVSVTVRVPQFAPAGERFATRVQLFDGDGPAITATGTVAVSRKVGVDLQGPGDLEGSLGMPLSFELVVANEGNAPDTIRLSARHTHWDVHFESVDVALEPGERRVVRVTLRPTTTVNSGYRHIFYLVATPVSDPDSESVVQVVSRFFRGGTAERAREDDRPRITLDLTTTATASVEIEGDRVTAGASYRLGSSIGGELSDYVEGAARTNPLAGSIDDPFAEVPSSLALSLRGPGWDGSLSAGPGRYALAAGVDLEGWRLSGGGAVAPGDLISADVRLENRDLDLQVSARTGLQGARRTDTVAASYSTELADRVELSLSTAVNGYASDDYQVALGVSERLTWSGDAFDVSQSYAGVPLAGVHTVGVSGGTRRIHPFGVRARTSYSISPVTDRWNASATVYGSPLEGLTLDVTGAATIDGSGLGGGTTWSISPRLGYTLRPSDRFAASFAARYGHGGVIAGTGTTWDRYEAGARLAYLDLGISGTAAYEVRRGEAADAADASLEATGRADYDLAATGVDASLFARYHYEERTLPLTKVRHEIGLGWDHVWSGSVASRLGYQRTIDPLGGADAEGLNGVLSVSDVFVPGVQLSAGYSVTSPTSLLDFDAAFVHDVRFGIGYDVSLSFDTPDPVVDLFGGRRGGEVYGIAFLDRDLDGVFDDDERPLDGLTVRLGSDSTVTGADGSYRLRVPEGEYQVSFPVGLPATVDLYGERGVAVVENERQERPLAFAPVVSVTIELFDDRDNDAAMDGDEEGIPFGGVVLDGPQRRVVRTDGAGQAIVSGLVTGIYTVLVSADHLPSGYRATTEAVHLTLNPGDRPAVVRLGAARPPKSVVRTFSSGSLAVLPRVLQGAVAAGAEVELEALVQGTADRVVVVHPGGETAFTPDGARWRTRIRIPRETPIGPLELTVRADGGEQSVERPAFVNVVDRPPFVASGVVAGVNEELEVVVDTLFPAGTASLAMPGGETLILASQDGYHWTATWRAPAEGGRFRAGLRVDDEELGEISVSVFAPPSETDAPDVDAPTPAPAAAPKEGDVDD